MSISRAVLLFCCIVLASAASGQLDPDPDGIGVYFDESATQVVASVPVGESVSAYLVATNPSLAGSLALWEASVGPLFGQADVNGSPINAFNMVTNMPGDWNAFFACALYTPYPNLEPVTILANLEILVLGEDPVGIWVGGLTYDLPMYRVNDMYHGPETSLYQSSGDPYLPVAVINGAAPVSNENQTWGGVKALYR